ncbi:MAG: NADH-quinone oxidoreductase subunit J [Gammaproteobacteria bacterium]|jgi:NADH-quinone oxidoreductase subunit J|nr:NADH-quinone oxidoreductase subunit J [Gammaproteobacteria bacterium]
MSSEEIIFYAFSAILIFAAGMVITIRNPVFAALSLVLAFFTSAALWILLEAEFLGLTLVLVYVGAVMVLFLFVVMMLDINLAVLKEGFAKYLPFGAVVAIIMLAQLAVIVGPKQFGLDKFANPVAQGVEYSNTKELGRQLYTDYLYPFEIAAVILLVAIIAAIALTMRKRVKRQTMQPEQQVQVKRNERVRLVKMPAEKKL